jgi:hypothetical protein
MTSVIPFLIVERVEIRKYVTKTMVEFQNTINSTIEDMKKPKLQSRDDWTLQELYESQNEIWIGALTYGATTTAHIDVVKEAWEAGTLIKIMILDPDSPNFGIFTEGLGQYTIPQMKQHCTETIAVLDQFKERSEAGGIVEIRKYPTEIIPFYSSFFMNPPNGKIKIEMFVQGTLGRRPSMFLNKEEDQPWYESFIEDYETMWEKSTPL